MPVDRHRVLGFALAVLNYGDCLAYGIAMSEGEPLLFEGDDFSQTDVEAVQY